MFNTLLYYPLLNLLFIIYNAIVADLGIAIILLTILVRLILLPIFYKSAKDQTIIQKIAPQIREIQKKHKDDKEKQVAEMMAIYKEHQINPFSSFLLIFLQLPIMWALYRVFTRGFNSEVLSHLYSFVAAPAQIHYSFLGLLQLDQRNLALVVAAAIFQFLQSYLLMRINKKAQTLPPKDDPTYMAQKLSQSMLLFTPVLTAVILLSLPSAVALYWMTTSAFSVIQQIIINKKIQNNEQRSQGNS
jgi:YidC/Oxa1 family membrane protein insertase